MSDHADLTEGRCISCGFLAHHEERLLSQEHLEVKPKERENPVGEYHESMFSSLPSLSQQQRIKPKLGSYLVCFLQKADLFAELTCRVPGSPKLEPAVNSVLNSDRRCPHYVEYIAGLSPKEHVMERRLLALEEDRRAFQRALDRGAKGLMWAALILAIGQIIAALIAMTPESYGAKWLGGLFHRPIQQTDDFSD